MTHSDAFDDVSAVLSILQAASLIGASPSERSAKYIESSQDGRHD